MMTSTRTMKWTGLRDLIFTTLQNRRHIYDPTYMFTYEDIEAGAKQIHEDIITSLYWVAEQSTCKEIMLYLLFKHVRAWEKKNG